MEPKPSTEAARGGAALPLSTYTLILMGIWTIIIGASLWFGLRTTYSHAEEYARIQARTAFTKDLAYRNWVQALGAVYAPITDKTMPNPYLDVKGRDLDTGHLKLTKINPAYMVRLVHEMEAAEINFEVIGHLTGNDPLRPANKSDEWEEAALEAMADDRDMTEITALGSMNGKDYMRLIRPLTADSTCSECHPMMPAGSLGGGISVSVPMEPILASANRVADIYIISHGFIWALGMLLFGFGANSLRQRIRQRDKAEKELRLLTAELEKRVQSGIEAAASREQQVRAFMDNTDSGVYLKDADMRYVLANRQFCALFSVDCESLLGRSADQVLPPRLQAEFAAAEKLTAETMQPHEIEDLCLNGQNYSVHIFPMKTKAGTFNGLGGIVVNTTQRKRMEEAMRAARDSAESANKAKSDFLANVSHEIRTPLNGVMGMADLLLRTDLTKEQAAMAATIKSSSDSLLNVLNDILDFSKIENGKMLLDPTPFSLRDMVFDAVANIVPAAYRKDLEIIVHVAPGAPDHLIGDWTRLRQVLLNLASNAVKFTEKGEVALAVRVLSQDAGKVKLRLSVTDTGIGIDRDKQKMIFSAFEQIDSSSTRKYGGTGLGLAISTHLVKLMGSGLCLESSPGYGSSFWFDVELPFIEDGAQPKPLGSVEALKGVKVLVVDDNPTNLHIFKEQLQLWGIAPQVCGSAEEALRQLRLSLNKGEPFDIVLTDLQMPETDGLELLEAMRQDEELKSIPGILLSSGEIPAAALENPVFSANLTKPVRPEDLLRAMASALGLWERFDMNTLRAKVLRHGRGVYARRLRILLVEDMEVNQMVGEAMLTELGHDVAIAANGQEAVGLLNQHSYDLIFMDIQMPVMDGLQATRIIKANPRLKHLPIVAMTAHALKGDKEKYLSQEMDAYIAKPMAMHELINVLNEIVLKFELGAPLLPEEVDLAEMGDDSGTVTLKPGFSAAESNVANGAAFNPGGPLSAEEPAARTASGGAEKREPAAEAPTAPGKSRPTVSAEEIQQSPLGTSAAEAVRAKPPGGKMLDYEAMEKVFSGHPKLIVQSMNLYVQDAPGLLEQIAGAVADNDNSALTMSAHTLKGITRYYTTGLGYSLCLELEMAGREKDLPAAQAAAAEKVAALRACLAELLEEIKEYIAANSGETS